MGQTCASFSSSSSFEYDEAEEAGDETRGGVEDDDRKESRGEKDKVTGGGALLRGRNGEMEFGVFGTRG